MLDRSKSRQPIKKRAVQPIPHEGDDGVYSQTWWPVCLSSDVEKGQVIGRELMNGRVIVFRGEDGDVSVMSAYCAHVGADLSVGEVVGNTIRCAFHHFAYDHSGKCVSTGMGEPPPPSACVFKFPTAERHGVIWAFNREEPLFDMWSFTYPDDEIVVAAEVSHWGGFEVDLWVVIGQIPDANHAQFVHDTEPAKEVKLDYWEYGASRLRPELDMGERDKVLNLHARIFGTNIAVMESTFNGEWSGGSGPLVIPAMVLASMWETSVVISGASLVGQEAPAKIRGAVSGQYAVCGAIGVIAATSLGGVLFDTVAYGAPYVMMAAVNIMLCVYAVAVIAINQHHPERPALTTAAE